MKPQRGCYHWIAPFSLIREVEDRLGGCQSESVRRAAFTEMGKGIFETVSVTKGRYRGQHFSKFALGEVIMCLVPLCVFRKQSRKGHPFGAFGRPVGTTRQNVRHFFGVKQTHFFHTNNQHSFESSRFNAVNSIIQGNRRRCAGTFSSGGGDKPECFRSDFQAKRPDMLLINKHRR